MKYKKKEIFNFGKDEAWVEGFLEEKFTIGYWDKEKEIYIEKKFYTKY